MAAKKDAHRILIISKTEKTSDLLRDVLPPALCRNMSCVTSAGDAKRLLIGTSYDIIIINAPLVDDFGIQTALDIAEKHNVGVLLLVKSELYEQAAYEVEDAGVVTLPKQTTKQTLYMTIRMLGAVQARIQRMEKENRGIQNKLNEVRVIDRAKWILIDQLKMSEPEAHRYIEKHAMDRCVKRVEIAENIIRTYR